MEKIGFYCSSTSWGGLEMNFVRFAIRLSNRNYRIKFYCVEDSPIANRLKSTDYDVTYVQKNKNRRVMLTEVLELLRKHRRLSQGSGLYPQNAPRLVRAEVAPVRAEKICFYSR